MRIPLQIAEGKLFISAIIMSHRYRIGIAQVVFAVDTGSSETFISESDALRMALPINNLSFSKHIRMGGSVFELKGLPNIEIKFKTDEGKLETIRLDTSVALSTKKDEKNKQIAQSFPSILGTDFLKDNKLSLHFIPHKDEAYLERE